MKHLVKAWDGTDSMLCGQLSIAMVTEKPVEDVISTIGYRHGSTPSDLLKTLERLGFEAHDVDLESTIEGRGIAIVEDLQERRGHAVAWENGKIYDPDGEDLYHDFPTMIAYFAEYNISLTYILRVTPVKTREWTVGRR